MSRWFRVYDDAMNDPKLLLLSDALKWAWFTMLCTASQNDGKIPSNEIAAIALRTSPRKAGEIVGLLASRGLLDQVEGGYFEPHNWKRRQYKSDVSTERVKEFREREQERLRNVSSTVPETPPEAEANTEPEADQQSLTNTKNIISMGNVKGKRYSPPRHCAISRDKRRVYIESGTAEWEAYAKDFRDSQHREPIPNAHGGMWFKTQGEAAE